MSVARDVHRVYRRVSPTEAYVLGRDYGLAACRTRFHWHSGRNIGALAQTGQRVATGEISVAEIPEEVRLLDLVDEHGIATAFHDLGLDGDRLKLAHSRFGRLFPSGPINPPKLRKARRHG